MTVERWEEESDEEWAERLAEEIAIANNTETTQYFFKSGYEEDEIILNYVGKDSWTWKNHPEGPFKATQILEWKKGAEKWDEFCKCLRWGVNTPVETILLEIHAINTGNQDKKKKLESIKKLHPELIEILNMDWIWLSKPPLDKLLKWEKKFGEALQSSTQSTKEGKL